MSWGFSVSAVAKDKFGAAVDAAVVSGQDTTLPGGQEAVDEAKAAMKALGKQVQRECVAGSGSGHRLQPDEGDGMADSLSVNVYGSHFPPPP